MSLTFLSAFFRIAFLSVQDQPGFSMRLYAVCFYPCVILRSVVVPHIQVSYPKNQKVWCLLVTGHPTFYSAPSSTHTCPIGFSVSSGLFSGLQMACVSLGMLWGHRW